MRRGIACKFGANEKVMKVFIFTVSRDDTVGGERGINGLKFSEILFERIV